MTNDSMAPAATAGDEAGPRPAFATASLMMASLSVFLWAGLDFAAQATLHP